jgi:hypothetical protein
MDCRDDDGAIAKARFITTQIASIGDIINSPSSGSFVPWDARVSKKAPVGRAVHQNAALLTG